MSGKRLWSPGDSNQFTSISMGLGILIAAFGMHWRNEAAIWGAVFLIAVGGAGDIMTREASPGAKLFVLTAFIAVTFLIISHPAGDFALLGQFANGLNSFLGGGGF